MNRTAGRNMARRQGVCPAIVLSNPKYPHNIGAVIRAASCFGAKQVWVTGKRGLSRLEEGKRLPREERMKGYADVDLIQYNYPLDSFPYGVPIAVELRENAESLVSFEHPDNAVYLFGPEDGSLPATLLRLCHRFVVIPSHHCLNLAAAVNVVLYDRRLKRIQAGLEPQVHISELLKEHRGPAWGDNPLVPEHP